MHESREPDVAVDVIRNLAEGYGHKRYIEPAGGILLGDAVDAAAIGAVGRRASTWCPQAARGAD